MQVHTHTLDNITAQCFPTQAARPPKKLYEHYIIHTHTAIYIHVTYLRQ